MYTIRIMRKIILIFITVLFTNGCAHDQSTDHGFKYVDTQENDSAEDASSGDSPVDTPPKDTGGSGVDSDSDSDSDQEDSGSPDTGGDTADDSVVSYEDCSNSLPALPWEEPAYLSKPCNFRLLDQDGSEVELYDFEGDVILIDFSTMWCVVCRTVAGHAQGLHDQYGNFTLLTVLIENADGDPPTVDNLQEWSDAYGITTAPVLAGSNSIIGSDIDQWSVSAWPTFFLVDKDFYLRRFTYWNEDLVAGYVEDLLAE